MKQVTRIMDLVFMSLGHVIFMKLLQFKIHELFKPKNNGLHVLGIQTSHAIR